MQRVWGSTVVCSGREAIVCEESSESARREGGGRVCQLKAESDDLVMNLVLNTSQRHSPSPALQEKESRLSLADVSERERETEAEKERERERQKQAERQSEKMRAFHRIGAANTKYS